MKLLYIDLFCGAGGTSTGVENARHDGRQCAKVIGCVNHDANAIASHAANHPDAMHFTEDIRTLELSPLIAHIAKMRKLYPDAFVVLWASLECTNFSKAKGGQPRDADSRTLAEHLFRYIEAINPDYIQIENVEEFMSWGDLDENGKPKYYGRFNQGVVTINLVDVALSSGGNFEKFWKIFDERLDLCHRALQARHKRLLGTPSDAAPILWQYGALARLKKGEKIDKLLFGGYSTISLGYAGLYECVKYMTGKSHTDAGSKPFALSVMQHMNDKCNAWKKAENMDYSLYGTPLESTTYKFAKCLQKRFGIVKGITDKNYITNSYHVHVSEPIDAFTKLKFEADFQRLSPGGAISYVEVPNMQDNLEAVISVLQFIYDNIMYAELNTKSDYCQVCGYDGEIKIVEDDGKLVWECPKCGNRDQNKLNVARRTCGYIGTQFWNQGRTQEIKDRVLHL